MKNILLLSVLAAISCGNYASATMEQTPSKTSKLPPKYIIQNVDAPRNFEQMNIFDAIEDGNAEAVSEITYKDKKMVNALNSTEQRFTPLHFAVMKGNLDVIWALLKAGAKVDAKNSARRTPINYAKSDEIKRLFATWENLKLEFAKAVLSGNVEYVEKHYKLDLQYVKEHHKLDIDLESHEGGYGLANVPISEETLLNLGEDKLVKVLKFKDLQFGKKERKEFLPIEIAFCLEDINMVDKLCEA